MPYELCVGRLFSYLAMTELLDPPRANLTRELGRLARFGANLAEAYSCLIFMPTALIATPLVSTPLFSTPLVSQSSGPRSSRQGQEYVGAALSDRGYVLSGQPAYGGAARSGARLPAGLAPALDHDKLSSPLSIAALHSLSSDLVTDLQIRTGTGLIGWVAKHNRSIHVSPFERDSTTLGIYSSDQALKSFIGVPIALPSFQQSPSEQLSERDGALPQDHLCGVLTCDSKKSFAFTKLQGKLLEELAEQISSVVRLALNQQAVNSPDSSSWSSFTHLAVRLISALGGQSTEILRLRFSNLDELEAGAGTTATLELTERALRLIHQSLPPHFPVMKLAQGDLVMVIDNMMSSFYENKVRAICDRLTQPNGVLALNFARQPLRGIAVTGSEITDNNRIRSELDNLIAECALRFGSKTEKVTERVREYRSA